MSCGHIGERNGLPCLRLDPGHVSEHIYKHHNRPPKHVDRQLGVRWKNREPLPPGELPRSATLAMIRYQLDFGTGPHYNQIMDRLRSQL